MDPIEVRRSVRRRKTVQAYRKDGKTIVLVPAALRPEAEKRLVDSVVAKLNAKISGDTHSDAGLAERAAELNEKYFDGSATPTSIRWVSNQQHRWGSCSVQSGAIRLSDRMRGMPQWVIDSVIVHELAHLLESGHGPAFRDLVAQYPKNAEADAYLAGFTFAQSGDHSSSDEPPEDSSSSS